MQIVGNQVVEVKNNQHHLVEIEVDGVKKWIRSGRKIPGTVLVYANIYDKFIILKRTAQGNKIQKPIKQLYSTVEELNLMLTTFFGVSVTS